MRKFNLCEKYGMLRSRLSIIAEDLQTKSNIPMSKRMNLLMKGFNSWHYTLYDLKSNNIKDYLSEYERRKTRFINGQAAYILSDKLVCDQILSQYVKTATIFSILFDGIIYPLDDEIVIENVDTLINYLEKIGPLMLKPNIGTDGGRGVILVEMKKGTLISNGRPINLDELKKLIKSLNQYIVCKFIIQGSYGNCLFNETVNSIRILTMISPNAHKPFIAAAAQRIGTYASKPIDNWAAGGLSVNIDINTGILSEAVLFKDGKIKYYDSHPDTGNQIKGNVVPKWGEIKEKTLELASKLPYLPYVAWDIVPLDDEILIIEANNCSDVGFLQVHVPLLKNEKVRKFYEYHGIF